MVIGLYSQAVVGSQDRRMRILRDHDQACAEKLVLLREMLATASQYLTQCGDVMNSEDSLMLGIAADEIPLLRLRCMELSKDLGAFQKRVRERIKTLRLAQSENPSAG